MTGSVRDMIWCTYFCCQLYHVGACFTYSTVVKESPGHGKRYDDNIPYILLHSELEFAKLEDMRKAKALPTFNVCTPKLLDVDMPLRISKCKATVTTADILSTFVNLGIALVCTAGGHVHIHAHMCDAARGANAKDCMGIVGRRN